MCCGVAERMPLLYHRNIVFHVRRTAIVRQRNRHVVVTARQGSSPPAPEIAHDMAEASSPKLRAGPREPIRLLPPPAPLPPRTHRRRDHEANGLLDVMVIALMFPKMAGEAYPVPSFGIVEQLTMLLHNAFGALADRGTAQDRQVLPVLESVVERQHSVVVRQFDERAVKRHR